MSDAMKKQLTDLGDEVARLREQVGALVKRVESDRAQQDLSMRTAVRCPACGCRRILYASSILDRDGGATQPLSVGKKGLFMPKVVGPFECHICTRCGLVEWYVRDVSDIDIDNDMYEIREVDDQASGPYR